MKIDDWKGPLLTPSRHFEQIIVLFVADAVFCVPVR
jgi:hypothetical protein